jgi:hypothetical protein
MSKRLEPTDAQRTAIAAFLYPMEKAGVTFVRDSAAAIRAQAEVDALWRLMAPMVLQEVALRLEGKIGRYDGSEGWVDQNCCDLLIECAAEIRAMKVGR